ncbi:MAG: 5-formyltetrahydrofolate cyclo-ligase [Desulfomonilia bacterium]
MGGKSAIRKSMLVCRQRIAGEDKKRSESRIITRIRALPQYREARVIALYVPVRGEVDLLPLLEDTSKTTLFPKVHGEDLAFYPAACIDTFVPGRFGIPEPPEGPVFPIRDIDLIFVPGISFDRTGHRIGYGKGYYDRLMRANGHVATIGVCFDECLVDRLPADSWDVQVECVVTQTEVIFRSKNEV